MVPSGDRAKQASPLQLAQRLRWPLLGVVIALPLIATGCNGTPLTAGTLVEQLMIGLILGSIYALIALGYTLVYGVIKLINFAHGDIYMVGAFVGYYALRLFIRWLNFTGGVSLIWCFALSVLVSAVICAALAMLIERLAYRPLRKSTRIAALITAVGVSFLLENLGIIVFGANPKSYEPKTLAVYQLHLVESWGDSGAEKTRIVELTEVTQYSLPFGGYSGDLDAGGEMLSAAVCLVSPEGVSELSPWVNIWDSKPSDYVELTQDEARLSHVVIPSIGYTTREEKGKKLTTISWAAGPSQLTSLNPVFSDKDGKALAFTLPLNTAAGTPVRVPYFNVVILAVTALTLTLLNLLINRTMFGISMRALSLDINAAKLMGVNTDAVIAWTFAIGGAAAAIAGNMVGLYNQTLEPLMGVLPGLKAFVAAVVGGIGSIPGAAVGGIIMGVSEALVKGAMPARYSALADALAFALLIVVLLFKPSGIFGRTLKEKSMINPYWELIILLALVNVIFAVSLNLILGYNGQFALGHAGFLLIGAYASGVATSVLGWPLWAGIALAIALSTLAAVIVGYPSLRLRGDYLAIATLGFAEIIRIVALTLPAEDARGRELFGGPTGKDEVLKFGQYVAVPEAMNGAGNFVATLVFAAMFVGLIVWGVVSFGNFLQKKFQHVNLLTMTWVAPVVPVGVLIVFLPAYKTFLTPYPEMSGWRLVLFIVTRLLALGFLWFVTYTTKQKPVKRAVLQGAVLLVMVFWPIVTSNFIGIFQFNNAFRQVAFDSKQWALFAAYALIVSAVLLLVRNYLRSSMGRAAIAIREDEIAASNLGCNVFAVKLRNFMLGCGLAGLAGALTAHTLPLYRPGDFDLFRSVDVLLMVVLGGMGSLTGSVLGATMLTVLPEVLRFLAQWRLVIYSLVLILFMVFRPGGFMGRAEIGELIRFKFWRKDQPNVEGGPAEVRG